MIYLLSDLIISVMALADPTTLRILISGMSLEIISRNLDERATE